MTSGWSWYVIVLTLANIVACLWLIRWTAQRRPGERAREATTGHTWDGDLQEYNNPLPRWWLWLFYITIGFALLYLVLFPGLGAFQGLLGWTQRGQYQQEMAQAQAQYGPIFERYAKVPITQLSQDPEALQIGQRLFLNNCAACHGSDGGGGVGFPSLRDDEWLYGGKPEAIQTSILQGRQGVMPPFGPVLGTQGVEQVAAYVLSLSGRQADPQQVAAGRQKFQQFCIACHGPDAKGNPAIGAPNLTNDIWLYGGAPGVVRQTITHGRSGKMPAHKDVLGAEKAHLLAAYVYSLGGARPGAD